MNKALLLMTMAQAKDRIVPFYTNGVENVAWAAGYTLGTGTQSKEATYLAESVTGAADGTRTYTTVDAIDISLYNTIYFEAEGTIASGQVALFSLLSDKTTRAALGNVATINKAASFAKSTFSIDVSAVESSCYIALSVDTLSAFGTSSDKTYRVWGELA